MLIAVSGSQGSGKSTVLKALKEQNHIVVERKTSRSILSEWGKTLSEVNNNFDLLIKFQEEIIQRKIFDEQEVVLKNPGKLVFTERTFADVFVYTMFACGKDNEYSQWIDEYYRRCLKFQQSYDLVFYLTGGLFRIENDGVRGVNMHYGKMVDICMLDYTNKMTHQSKFNVVNTTSHDDRVCTIINQVESFIK